MKNHTITSDPDGKHTITSDYDILAVDSEGDTMLTSMGQSHVLGLSYVFGCRNILIFDNFVKS